MFEYFPDNYMWSLATMNNISFGGNISEIDETCRPLKHLAKNGSDPASLEAWFQNWKGVAERVEKLAAEDEAARHPQRNILTKALGIEADLAVDTWELVPVVGDRYLLCSDGLVNELDDSRIQRTLRDMAEPEAAAVELVRCAVNAGGHDNVTVVVADVVEALPGSGRTDLSRSRARAERSSTLGVSDGAGSISGTVWRVGGLALSAVLLLGVIVGVIGIYARSGWFVGFHDDHVAVFQGRPSGILWFDPTLTEVANLPVMDLADADRALVIEAIEVGSLEHARKVVVQLEERAQ